jgi:hypothetical protein
MQHHLNTSNSIPTTKSRLLETEYDWLDATSYIEYFATDCTAHVMIAGAKLQLD